MKGEKMATLKVPFALDRSLNTTEVTPRNIADVLAEGLSHITGRTASEVEYDNTDSGLTADNVQDALDEIVEDIPTVPSVDIQTAVDEFSTYNGGILDSLKVTLEPIQDLHGYAEPWIGGAGKNKYDDTAKTSGAYLNSDGTTSGSGASDVSDYIPIKNGDVVMLSYHYNTLASANARYNCLYDENKQFVDYMTYTPTGDDGFKEYKITISNANAKYIRYTLDKQINHVQVEFGSTATDYEPYENICPITGYTQSEVTVSNRNLIGFGTALDGFVDSFNQFETNSTAKGFIFKTSDLPDTITFNCKDGNRAYFAYFNTIPSYGTPCVYKDQSTQILPRTISIDKTQEYIHLQFSYGNSPSEYQVEKGSTATDYVPFNPNSEIYVINLGGTYYSGTLDVVSGVFTPDTAIATVSDFAFTAGKSDGDLAKVEYTPSNFKNSIEKLKCNMMPYVEQSASWTETEPCYTIANNTKLRVYFDGDTLADFQSDFADIQIIYELATPTPIQLSPTMVKALVGENHLSAPLDGQEITESEYRELFTWDEVEAYVNAHSGGGSGMNYSTEEQVVGTWIDNKPLYAKTIVYTPSGTISSNTTIANVPNAKVMRVTEATAYNSSENRGYTLPDVRANGGTKITYDDGDVTLEIISDSWSSSWTFYVTVQYTKTTD